MVRGYGGIRGDSEDDSEEDMDDNVAAVAMSQVSLLQLCKNISISFILHCRVVLSIGSNS